MHKCRSYGPNKLNLWPLYHLTFKCNPDLQPLPEQMFQMNSCARLFWNPCMIQYMTILSFDRQVWPWPSTYLNKCFKWHCYSSRITTVANYFECRSCGPEKLKLWPFYNLTFKCDLELKPTWTDVSNGTSTSQGEELCQMILKSMINCRSYGPDKLKLWPFYHLTFKCDLDLKPSWTNVSIALLLIKENNCPNYLKSMHKCRS